MRFHLYLNKIGFSKNTLCCAFRLRSTHSRNFLITFSVLFLLLACKSKQNLPQTTEHETTFSEKEEIVFTEIRVETAKELIFKIGAENFLLKEVKNLKDKRLALVVNHSSLVDDFKDTKHLADTLLGLGFKVQKVFAPEHGFRGDADAGETIKNDTDTKTGLPIISLYGKNKKPTPQQLADVDVVIFDIQDVGVRFFTYISTMHYVMEACAENKKTLYVLDRPNPNGSYVAGSVLQKGFESFVGMHPIPIVHGLTVGELAQMINGEKWLAGGLQCDLVVVKMQNYTHKTNYNLPVKPSPNLPNTNAVLWYPSLCLFEGTVMSVGRGTEFPFQVVGYPDKRMGDFTFTPKSIVGMAKNPLYENQICYGKDYRNTPPLGFTLEPLIEFYKKFPQKDKFFNNFFDKLAGNSLLRKQIEQGMSNEQIQETWKQDLENYKKLRAKYLLYED